MKIPCSCRAQPEATNVQDRLECLVTSANVARVMIERQTRLTGSRRNTTGSPVCGPRNRRPSCIPAAITHITGALFLSRIGADVFHIAYPKSGEAMRDLIAGRINFTFNPSLTAVGQVKAGAVRAFGVSSPARLATIPDLPTMSEAGLPDFVSQTWNTIAAPVDLPDEIVAELNAAVNAVAQSTEIRTRLEDLGSVVPGPMTPAEVDAYYETQRKIWIPVVRGTGATRSG